MAISLRLLRLLLLLGRQTTSSDSDNAFPTYAVYNEARNEWSASVNGRSGVPIDIYYNSWRLDALVLLRFCIIFTPSRFLVVGYIPE